MKKLSAIAAAAAVAGGTVASAPAQAAGSPIRHVIEIMLENHSFDNIFGSYPGAAGIPPGTTVANPAATYDSAPPIAPFVGGLNQGSVSGLDNSRNAEFAAMDYRPHQGYAMDLFAFFPRGGLAAITGTDPRLDPDTQTLAANYELLDHNFQPLIAPTSPNVITALTGDAHGWYYNDNPPANITYNSIFKELTGHQRSWNIYYGVPPSHILGSWWARLLPAGHDANVKTTADFITDAAAGKLPDFSMVRPGIGYSGEPSEDVQPPDTWAGQLIQAVMKSPEWKDTAIFLTWDEGGGFWDHMAPPSVNAGGYGTRTATLIVSPYARHQIYHHTTTNVSILSFMQHQWHLPALSKLNQQQDDLSGAFDFHQKPRPAVQLPVVPADTLLMANSNRSYAATPGRPFTFTISAMTAGLAPDTLAGPVKLTAVAPAGGAPATIPATVTMTGGTATVTATFPSAGFYRVTAAGPNGSAGWMTVASGAGPMTP